MRERAPGAQGGGGEGRRSPPLRPLSSWWVLRVGKYRVEIPAFAGMTDKKAAAPPRPPALPP